MVSLVHEMKKYRKEELLLPRKKVLLSGIEKELTQSKHTYRMKLHQQRTKTQWKKIVQQTTRQK
jgi:hypothetical protein